VGCLGDSESAKGIAGKALEEIEGLNIPLLENPVERVDVT
jgi:hypothetical protein